MTVRFTQTESVVQEIVPVVAPVLIDYYLDGTLAELVVEHSTPQPVAPVPTTPKPNTNPRTRIERLFSHD